MSHRTRQIVQPWCWLIQFSLQKRWQIKRQPLICRGASNSRCEAEVHPGLIGFADSKSVVSVSLCEMEQDVPIGNNKERRTPMEQTNFLQANNGNKERCVCGEINPRRFRTLQRRWRKTTPRMCLRVTESLQQRGSRGCSRGTLQSWGEEGTRNDWQVGFY